ncbi:MAG TPA: hypothetical protein VJX94_01635 [Stellaceae bacterium]|nr:hypothetical protein [Stellaceae bacterium]
MPLTEREDGHRTLHRHQRFNWSSTSTPEEARAIVDPVLKLMIDAVRRFDGYVAQSTGDGIFALFGAPGRARGPSAALALALCGISHAGGAACT